MLETMPAALKTASVPALERGLAVLEIEANSRNGLTFSQIARCLDFPKSSIHSLLLTFVREGYLHRSETSGRYTCGMKLIHCCPRQDTPVAGAAENRRLGAAKWAASGGGLGFDVPQPVQVTAVPV